MGKGIVSRRRLIQALIGGLLIALFIYFRINLLYVLILGIITGILFGKIFCRWMCPLGFIMESMLGGDSDIPTSGMTATWTQLSKGNLKVALSIIATSLLAVIIILPIVLPVFAGNLMSAGPWFILQRIMLVIVIPLVLGDITRRMIIAKRGQEFYKSKKPVFSGLSSTGLLFVLFLIMSLNANKLLIGDPILVLKGIIPLLIYYILMFGSSTLLAGKFKYPIRAAIVYGTSVRYLALALGIAVPLLGSGSNSSLVVFLIALAFFVQVPFSSLYSKFIIRYAGEVKTNLS